MTMVTQGSIDICQQVLAVGWAVKDGGPATVSIRCNGLEIASIQTSIDRPDVNQAMGAVGSVGFSYRFPRSIKASDHLTFGIAGTDVELEAAPHLVRIDRFTQGIRPDDRGIEIGPLDRPFLDKDHFDVNYVDHLASDDLKRKYKATGSPDTISVDDIVDVDIVWVPGQRLAACAGGSTFDYAVASQTMEHVADPIGWLNDIAACLVSGGRINLSLPDARRTFDHARRLSTASDMVEAFHRKWDRPRFRAVFDHIANVANPLEMPNHEAAALRQAYSVACIAEQGEYVDVHCHVWTSESFQQCWTVIDKLGICDVRVEQIWPPAFTSNEFIVSFVK